MPSDQEREETATTEYLQLSHAMQSGVQAEIMANLNDAHTPKHLRTGVNAAMVENAALVQLLIDRGLVTRGEWAERLRDGMRAEVARYEQRLTEHVGRTVRLA